MARTLLINAAEKGETRAALVEEGRLDEYRCDRADTGKLLGNLYKGRVVNLERGIGAAFVDLGVGRNGFLHVSDCLGGGGDKRIDEVVRLGGEVIVQVTREAIGPKGPVLTGHVSFPGRFLVLLPFATEGGISRRIGENDARDKLRALAKTLERRAGVGLILRTAAADCGQRELVRDLRSLQRLWASVEARSASAAAPTLLYTESDLVARALRDLVDRDVSRIVVDTPEALERARDTIAALEPELAERLELHATGVPLFHAFDLETQVDRLRARRVSLPGGGSIVFDRTEALLAIDVNSGRTREDAGLEETARRTNLEAAEEIARQLRLRDLGGVVVVDFIDMKEAAHVREVERAFKAALARDRSRIRSGRLGAFAIFALTRRRSGDGGASERRACPRCEGAGRLVDPAEVALRVFRELRARAAGRGRGALRARVGPDVAGILHSEWAGELAALEEETGRALRVEADSALPAEGWAVGPDPGRT